jgi:hypothetical protein
LAAPIRTAVAAKAATGTNTANRLLAIRTGMRFRVSSRTPFRGDSVMSTFTDETMRERLSKTKTYSSVLLRRGPRWDASDSKAVIWEHGRRNFELRESRKLCIVCPVSDESTLCGIGIFDADREETERIMREDPAIKAGIMSYEIHPCRGFPGDALA